MTISEKLVQAFETKGKEGVVAAVNQAYTAREIDIYTISYHPFTVELSAAGKSIRLRERLVDVTSEVYSS